MPEPVLTYVLDFSTLTMDSLSELENITAPVNNHSHPSLSPFKATFQVQHSMEE